MKLIPAIGQEKMRVIMPGEDEAMKTVAVWSVLFVVDDSVGGKDADETASLGRLNAFGNFGTGTPETDIAGALGEFSADVDGFISDFNITNFCATSATLCEISSSPFVPVVSVGATSAVMTKSGAEILA